MSKPTYVSDTTFENEVLGSKTPVLVDFYADWCGPCRAISPMLDEIADEADDQFSVVKLDIDDNSATATEYAVQSIPTLMLFKDGQPVERWIGIVPKDQILDGVRNHVASSESVQGN